MRHREIRSHIPETHTDGLHLKFRPKPRDQRGRRRDYDDGNQRTRQSARNLRGKDDNQQRSQTDRKRIKVNLSETGEINTPLRDEVARHVGQPKAEKVVHLRRKYGQGNTCRKTHHHRIRDELDYCAEPEQPHKHQNDSGHKRGHRQAGESELRDYSGHDDYESPGRAADLN